MGFEGARWWQNTCFWAMVVWSIFSFFAGILICYLILFTPDEFIGTASEKARAFTPVLGSFLAVLTFLTVLWRGTIQIVQANEQQRQNDAKDEENLAQLVGTASEKIKEEGRAAQSLGLTMLGTVINSKSDTYAEIAIDMVCNQIAPTFQLPTEEIFGQLRQIEMILQSASSRRDRRPQNSYNIVISDGFNEARQPLTLFYNFPPSEIRGAFVSMNEQNRKEINQREDLRFYLCTLDGFKTKSASNSDRLPIIELVDGRFSDCALLRLKIGSVDLSDELGELHGIAYHTRYVECDFSGTVFTGDEIPGSTRFQDCWYYEDNPPIFGLNKEPIGERFPEGIDGIRMRRGISQKTD